MSPVPGPVPVPVLRLLPVPGPVPGPGRYWLILCFVPINIVEYIYELEAFMKNGNANIEDYANFIHFPEHFFQLYMPKRSNIYYTVWKSGIVNIISGRPAPVS